MQTVINRSPLWQANRTSKEPIRMRSMDFDAASYLANPGPGRRMARVAPKTNIFNQGDPADSVFYLQSGWARLTVVSQDGKEATITLLSAGDFAGEECLAKAPGLRVATATAISNCSVLRIARDEMVRVMHQEPAFLDMFLSHMVARSLRTQADFVDQLFNFSEKRLARVLLLMAHFEKQGVSETSVPRLSQETMAEMVGTTRSRVSFFMNRFRKLGFVDYNGGLKVHSSLLNIVLHD